MMEPDHREESNKKGFCNKHFDMLYASSNKLPLALVLDTHLEEIRRELSNIHVNKKKGFFSKTPEKSALSEMVNSCMICEKIEKNMNRYCNVLLQMWQEDDEFRNKFENSQGFCIPHFEKLYSMSNNTEFLNALLQKEKKELELIQADIHKFTLKFDYRNKDMEWGTAQDAPIRTIEKISGYMNTVNDEE